MGSEPTSNKVLSAWISESLSLLKPRATKWILDPDKDYAALCKLLVETGEFTKLNESEYPNSFWYTSDPLDVARVEDRTFICCKAKDDAGPTNNWLDPVKAKRQLNEILAEVMVDRTLYVVPYLMGPAGSAFSKVGFELTDSAYVAASMCLMTRVGKVALDHLGDDSSDFVRGIHSTGSMDPGSRYICHFPETREIVSVNSNYGGNALQGKKCFALRIASCQARDEGWLAEHMLIVGVTTPWKTKHYICAAFPSACGKTNLAMLVPPPAYREAGWKVETVADDIAWLRIGKDGRLWATNPEAGFFGVAAGTSQKTNPNAIATISKNTIFTNTALDPERDIPWWDGKCEGPKRLFSWKNVDCNAESDKVLSHPNARFTVRASQCPSIDPHWESPEGVPISAIIFGGRRSSAAPLIYESFSWRHGTFVGATLCSELTAAAEGQVGKLRRDPMAMKPFIGYHLGDYFGHWLKVGGSPRAHMPRIFHVNWFRKDGQGKFLWPGFGENLRVIEWMIRRVENSVKALEAPLGMLPYLTDLNALGLDIEAKSILALFKIDPAEWGDDLASQGELLRSLGDRCPPAIWYEHEQLKKRLGFNTVGSRHAVPKEKRY